MNPSTCLRVASFFATRSAGSLPLDRQDEVGSEAALQGLLSALATDLDVAGRDGDDQQHVLALLRRFGQRLREREVRIKRAGCEAVLAVELTRVGDPLKQVSMSCRRGFGVICWSHSWRPRNGNSGKADDRQPGGATVILAVTMRGIRLRRTRSKRSPPTRVRPPGSRSSGQPVPPPAYLAPENHRLLGTRASAVPPKPVRPMDPTVRGGWCRPNG